jgi:hypothetical protein
MSKLSKKILKKIQKDHIKPRPKWQFILWHVSMWIFFTLSILLGSLVTGMLIFELMMTAWDFAPHLPRMSIFALLLFPAIWIASLAITVLIGYKAFSQTKKAYKHKPIWILTVSILISVIFGTIFFFTSFANHMNNLASSYIPPYADWQNNMTEMWVDPSNGIISGEITTLNEDETFTMTSHRGDTWTVNYSDASLPKESLEAGQTIIISGEENEEGFKANRIQPMHRKGPGHLLNSERKPGRDA